MAIKKEKKNPARFANNFIAWTDYTHTYTTIKKANFMNESKDCCSSSLGLPPWSNAASLQAFIVIVVCLSFTIL